MTSNAVQRLSCARRYAKKDAALLIRTRLVSTEPIDVSCFSGDDGGGVAPVRILPNVGGRLDVT